MTIGKCKHGEFELIKGCPQCIDEKWATGIEKMAAKKETEKIQLSGDPDAWRTGEEEMRPEETALTLRPGEDDEVRIYSKQAVGLLAYAERRVIASLEDNKKANDDLIIISKLEKAMEAKCKEYLDPFKAKMEAIRGTYNTLMAPALLAKKITKDKMLAYDAGLKHIREQQEEINRLKMEAAEAEMKLTGELSESLNLVEVAPEVKRVSTEMGTSGQRQNWKYQVLDFALLPDEFKVADNAMLNAIAKKHHDQKQVPGVRFYNEPIIAVRGRFELRS